jgi:hypothetical protein
MTDSLNHPGLGSNPADVGSREIGGEHVVTLAVGVEFDRYGWYGTAEQAGALAADLARHAALARGVGDQTSRGTQ